MREMPLDQPTATLIAGLAAAAGSTAVGVTAIVFGARQAHAALKHARDALQQQGVTSRQDRVWEEQRVVYQELAEWLTEHRHLSFPSDDPRECWQVCYNAAPRSAMAARVRMFAADEVVAAFKQLKSGAAEMLNLLQALEPFQPHMEPEPEELKTRLTGWGFSFASLDEAHRHLEKYPEAWRRDREALERALRTVYH